MNDQELSEAIVLFQYTMEQLDVNPEEAAFEFTAMCKSNDVSMKQLNEVADNILALGKDESRKRYLKND